MSRHHGAACCQLAAPGETKNSQFGHDGSQDNPLRNNTVPINVEQRIVEIHRFEHGRSKLQNNNQPKIINSTSGK
jgi:hypothetical protein